MRIGLIGAGKIGGTLARLFVAQGHEVALSNSRGPETLAELVAEIGPSARAVTPAEAAEFGEVVVVSVPLGRYQEVPKAGMADAPLTSQASPSRGVPAPEHTPPRTPSFGAGSPTQVAHGLSVCKPVKTCERRLTMLFVSPVSKLAVPLTAPLISFTMQTGTEPAESGKVLPK